MDSFFGIFCAPNKSAPDICGCTREPCRDSNPVMVQKVSKIVDSESAQIAQQSLHASTAQGFGGADSFNSKSSMNFVGLRSADNPSRFTRTAPGVPMAGIGAAFEAGPESGLFVHSFVPGGPAERCGFIMKGDELITVDGIYVKNMNAKQLAQVLIGPVGTKVNVGFNRIIPSTKEIHTFNIEIMRQQSVSTRVGDNSRQPSLQENEVKR